MIKHINIILEVMKRNMGSADRIVRILIAAVVATLFFTNVISGTLGIVLLVLSAVFVLTSLVSFCPLYTLFGFRTCPMKEK
jgi:hypothetical protein